jgi:CTD kinase subunit gamma
MSFDPFEARMQFLQLLRKLNASQLSIQKVVGYAIKYGSRCGEDLWECILEECHKVCPLPLERGLPCWFCCSEAEKERGRTNEQGSLNTRINLLYLLDSLLEVSLPLSILDAPYPPLVSDNLKEIVKGVVPEGEGVLNLRAAKQVRPSSSSCGEIMNTGLMCRYWRVGELDVFWMGISCQRRSKS